MKKKLGFQAFLLRCYVFFTEIERGRKREGVLKSLKFQACLTVRPWVRSICFFFFNYSDNFRDAEMTMGDGCGSLRWGIRS
jgi:hypothetical protein